MTALERLYNAAVVPVVVLDDAADAVPTAKALLAGGVDVMEITFRTAAAADSITVVAEGVPRHVRGRGHGHHARTVQEGRRLRRKVHRLPGLRARRS